MKKTRILIVEDEAIVAEDFQHTLTDLGYEVVGRCATADDAIKKAGELHPDLILMDIVLKGKKDGLYAAREINTKMDIPVIFVTVYSDRKLIENAKNGESCGYILKPFQEKQLLPSIEIALYKHKMEKQLEEAEAKYRGIVENCPDMIHSVDANGWIIFANQAECKFLGYSKKELIGKHIKEIYAPELWKNVEKGFEKLKQEGKLLVWDGGMVKKNGERLEVELRSLAVYDENGNFTKTRTIIRDFTKRKELEQELIQSEKMAAIGMIGTGIAHELNSPLTGICTVANVLQKRLGPKDPNFRLLEEMKIAADYCFRVIRDLVNFSRESSSELKAVNLNEAVTGVLTFIGHQVEMKKIEIVRGLESGLAPVLGNMSQLQQVFLHIITNAKNAMPQGGVLKIDSRTKRNETKHVEIEFTDSGCGIDPKKIDGIFDSFNRAKKSGQGLGLGLSVSHRIIKKHKGRIEVKSELGKGTTFTVKLPALPG